MSHSTALRGLIAGTAIAAAVAVCGPASAAAHESPAAAGCAPVVQLQSLTIPMAAGPRRSANALLPDDGGTLPPVVIVIERRTATADELALVIGTGTAARVHPLYVAPDGCVISWSRDVHPNAAPEGRRSVHTPAFTVRLVSLTVPACALCMRAV
jgi:hypothetical protein